MVPIQNKVIIKKIYIFYDNILNYTEMSRKQVEEAILAVPLSRTQHTFKQIKTNR